MHISADAHGGQKRRLNPPELESLVVVGCWYGCWERREPGFSGPLDAEPSFPAPEQLTQAGFLFLFLVATHWSKYFRYMYPLLCSGNDKKYLTQNWRSLFGSVSGSRGRS